MDGLSTLSLDSKTAPAEGSVDVSPLDEIPQPWRDAMENAGAYSIRDLAAKTGTGPTTVSDLLHGRKLSSERTMQAVADALRLPATTIREWAATARGEEKPFELPPEANRLTRRERDAILAVVRAMLDPGEEATAETAAASGKTGQLVDLARPPAPDLSRVAARRGESEGRRLRDEQDSDGTDPQDSSQE